MFEHFGLKDAFSGMWKYKWNILLISIIGTVIIVGLCAMFPIKTEKLKLDVGDVKELQMKSVSFYLDYQGYGESVTSKNLSAAFIKTMSDNECREYVMNLVINKYSRRDIAGFMGNGIDESVITSNSLAQYVYANSDEEKFAIKLVVRTSDAEFSETLLNAYLSWFKHMAVNEDSQVKIIELSKHSQVIPIETNETKTFLEKQQWSLTKIIGIAFLICVLLSIIGIFFKILFTPTLNRKSDFEALGLNVLGEISIKERG